MRDYIFIKQALRLGVLVMLCSQTPLAVAEEPRILSDEEMLNEAPVVIKPDRSAETIQERRGNDGTAEVKVKSLWGGYYCMYFDNNRPLYHLDEGMEVASNCR